MVAGMKLTITGAMLVAFCASGCLAQSEPLPGPDWPHWRGPDRNDITLHTSGWKQGAWPLANPTWSRQVGMGGTSPITAGERVFVMGWANHTDTVHCLDATTGAEVWIQTYPCPKHGRQHKGDEGLYGGPSATPEFDRETGYLYTLSIDGDLNCWDTGDEGRQVWGQNLYDAYGVPRRPDAGGGQRDYGYTTAPLAYGEWLIVEVGSDEGTLMAYDKRTGVGVWASDCTDPAGHAGGLVPMTVEGVPCVAALTLNRLVVVRLDEDRVGETVATYDWQTHYANNITTPAVASDSIILSSSYNINRTERVRITLAGAEKVWALTGRCTGVCSPVVYGGHVYWAWRRVVCIDFETGKLTWEGDSFQADGSCVVTGDGRLIVLASKKLRLVETAERSPDAYTELASKTGVGASWNWPHVVVAGGRIYAKDVDGELMCYELRGE